MIILYWLIRFYIIVLFITAVLSWFPIRPESIMFQVKLFCSKLTEPVLSKVRQVIPPIGMVDVSFIVVIIALSVLQNIVATQV